VSTLPTENCKSIIDGRWWGELARRRGANRLIKTFLRRISGYISLPIDVQLALNLTDYPAYMYCVYHAAQLARRLGLDRISVIEFGVAGGNGLVFLDQLAERVAEEVGVRVQVYGFDSGKGLPEATRPEDLPYWFQKSQYRGNTTLLAPRLKSTQLILGDVNVTVADFFATYHPAPVGAVLNDLDLYSSTADSLSLFDNAPDCFLPRVFVYFDDIIGSELEMYSSYNGQLRAIAEFNQGHNSVYLDCNRNLLPRCDLSYRYQIYYAHLLSHPRYASFVGHDEQVRLEAELKLKVGKPGSC